MKRKYEVRWYEYDLTQQKNCKFYTEKAARFYAKWLEKKFNVKPKIYEVE